MTREVSPLRVLAPLSLTEIIEWRVLPPLLLGPLERRRCPGRRWRRWRG